MLKCVQQMYHACNLINCDYFDFQNQVIPESEMVRASLICDTVEKSSLLRIKKKRKMSHQ